MNDQKCPSEKPVAGIPFRGGELKCYNEETIIDKGRLIDINQKKWITLHTHYYSMYKLEGGRWKKKSFRVRYGKRRSLMIYPESGRLRLIKGLHHPVLLRTYGIDNFFIQTTTTQPSSTSVKTSSAHTTPAPTTLGTTSLLKGRPLLQHPRQQLHRLHRARL